LFLQDRLPSFRRHQVTQLATIKQNHLRPMGDPVVPDKTNRPKSHQKFSENYTILGSKLTKVVSDICAKQK
jgi:hypothetical protein